MIRIAIRTFSRDGQAIEPFRPGLDFVCIRAHYLLWIAGTFLSPSRPTAGSRSPRKEATYSSGIPQKPGASPFLILAAICRSER